MPWQATVFYTKPPEGKWIHECDLELNDLLKKVIAESIKEAGGFINRSTEIVDENSHYIRTTFETRDQLDKFVIGRTNRIDAFRERMMETMNTQGIVKNIIGVREI